MRNRIITLAAATLAAGALSLAGMAGASASTHPIKNATTTCSYHCFDLSNLQLDGTGRGSFIQNAVGGQFGTSLNMRRAGNAKTNEDFKASYDSNVYNACAAGYLTPGSIFCLNIASGGFGFGYDPVFQAQFAPFGNETGVCVGNQVANVAGRVALMPCGVGATTMWVFDTAHFTRNGYAAWLNGADTNFSNALTLTVNPSSKTPRNVLRTDPENTQTNGGLPDTQLFTFRPGPA